MIQSNSLNRGTANTTLEARVMLAKVSSDYFDDSEAVGIELTSEGESSFNFDALSNPTYTENGNGPRSELKIDEDERVGISETDETFSAKITPTMSDGARASFAQFKVGSEATLLIYISDGQRRGDLDNDEPGDGIFNIYAQFDEGDDEKYFDFGTIESGETFDFSFDKDGRDITIKVDDVEEELKFDDSDDDVMFKFGNYTQSQDPNGSGNLTDGGSKEAVDELADVGITESKINFNSVDYERKNQLIDLEFPRVETASSFQLLTVSGTLPQPKGPYSGTRIYSFRV